MLEFPDRLIGRFDLLDIRDPRDLGPESRIARHLYDDETANTYRLRDTRLRHSLPGPLLTRFANRWLGDCIMLACNSDRYAVAARIGGEGQPRTCFSLALRGSAAITVGARTIGVAGARGAIFRADPGVRLDSSDDSRRFNFWIADQVLERMLDLLLEGRPHGTLRFDPALDWSSGPGASLLHLLRHLLTELGEDDGFADSPIALTAFCEAVAHLMLRRLPHNHSAMLARPAGAAIPRQLRRAEAWMEAHADRPVTLAEIAAAAGCSLRGLQEAFRRFRETTPHAALQAIRLQRVRAALAAEREVAPGTLARRFGFTNATRFRAAYTRRFGETPAETQRRGGRH